MALPKNILFPVDFSDHCRSVWPAVAAMGRALNAPITMLHAAELAVSEVEGSLGSPSVEIIREHLRRKLDDFLGQDISPLSVTRELVEGAAGECIVDFAANMESPLIMMPSRGHTRFRQLLLGSVTAAVLHDAVGPVWVDAHKGESTPSAGVHHSILCAVDLGPKTADVLRTAVEFSAHLAASLHVVHSVPGIDPRFPSGPADRAHALLVHNARADYPRYGSAVGTQVPMEIVEDVELVSGILRVAGERRSDLLVIGRGVIQGPLGRLRTNAHELIRRSPCPVLSV
jgi:nucleotide-binding universal stress UspA family protein